MSRRGSISGLALASAAALSMAVAGCGSSPNSSGTPGAGATGADSVKVNLGSTTVSVKPPMKLAFFELGTNNSYLQANIRSVKEAVGKLPGASVQVFDGKFDPSTQFNQIQNALQSGKFNTAIALPADPQLLCKALTQAAPSKGVIVSVMTNGLCGRAGNEGAGLRAPGTLTYVGGVHTQKYWKAYLDYVVKQNPGPQKVLVLTGPKINAITVALNKALADIQKEHPEFKVVASGETDYSVPVAQQKMVPMLQAHQDATLLFSAYSNLTKGAIQAMKAAGKLGKIKIYDKGGTTYAVQQLKAGTIEATTPEYPVTIIKKQVELLNDALNGKTVPPFVPNDGAPLPADADPATGLVVIDKNSVATFKAESD